MAFSRSFKNHIWHIQLPTGEVVTADAAKVERAFRCGLVDGRTLVRASTVPTWEPLADAAGLEPTDLPTGTEPERASLLSDQELAPLWKVRDEEVDPRAIRGSRFMPLSMVGGILTLLALVGYGVTARADTGLPEYAMAQRMAPPAPPPTSTAPANGPHPSHDYVHPVHEGRFDAAEIKRLREMDYTHRMQGFGNRNTRWHVVSPSSKALAPPPNWTPGPPSKFDPLNGDL